MQFIRCWDYLIENENRENEEIEDQIVFEVGLYVADPLISWVFVIELRIIGD